MWNCFSSTLLGVFIVTADKFLNIFSACLGFIAVMYFAAGMLRMNAEDVWRTVRNNWDINEHQLRSIAAQRAEYIVGATFLLLSFSSQLSANLVPSSLEPSFLQPYGCAVSEIASALALLLVLSTTARGSILQSTVTRVLKLQAEAEAREQLEIESRKKS